MEKIPTRRSAADLILLSDRGQHTEPATTSLIVAEKFGKRHDTVLRAIRNLDCSTDFNARNFAAVEYLDAKGELRPMYRITRDGFAFLAMGFTGKATAEAVAQRALREGIALKLAAQMDSLKADLLRLNYTPTLLPGYREGYVDGQARATLDAQMVEGRA